MFTRGSSLPVKVSVSAFAQENVFVCHVQAPPIPPDTAVLQGTADFYELVGGVFTVATNNHVIPITEGDFLINTVFTFEGIGQIKLSEEEIKFCTTNKELDATVIELTEAGVKRLQQFGAKFTRVTSATGGDKSPEGEFSIDRGAIKKINENEVYYYLDGALSSNGSPFLLWDYRDGMHKQSGTSIEHRALVPILRGCSPEHFLFTRAFPVQSTSTRTDSSARLTRPTQTTLITRTFVPSS